MRGLVAQTIRRARGPMPRAQRHDVRLMIAPYDMTKPGTPRNPRCRSRMYPCATFYIVRTMSYAASDPIVRGVLPHRATSDHVSSRHIVYEDNASHANASRAPCLATVRQVFPAGNPAGSAEAARCRMTPWTDFSS